MSSSRLEPLFATVRHSAAVCKHVQETHVVGFDKPGREPVTIADFASQAIICHSLMQHYPEDAVVAEEKGGQFLQLPPEKQTEVATLVSNQLEIEVRPDVIATWLDHGRDRETPYTWVIDPIDGTKGFLAQRSYTIAVGLLHHRQPVAGILGSPGYKDGRLFFAENGTAYESPLAVHQPVAIAVSKHNQPTQLVMTESVESGHADHALMAGIYDILGIEDPPINRIDGQDKYGLVASGAADVYLRITPSADYREKIWDHAAGVAVVSAAGGTVTDEFGKSLDFAAGNKLQNNQSVIVSNGQLHAQIIEAIQQARQRA